MSMAAQGIPNSPGAGHGLGLRGIAEHAHNFKWTALSCGLHLFLQLICLPKRVTAAGGQPDNAHGSLLRIEQRFDHTSLSDHKVVIRVSFLV